MASLISYNRPGIMASRSASGHHAARKETFQTTSTPSRAYAHLPPFPSRRTSGCRTCRFRTLRRIEDRHTPNRRSAIPRRRMLLRSGSIDRRLKTADRRLQSGQRSIGWSVSFLWKNVLQQQQRKINSARTPGGGRGALKVAVRSRDLQIIPILPKFNE